jgi:hypothetical protein
MRANRIRTARTWFINYGLVNQGRFTRRATVPTAIVLRWSSQAQVTLDYFSAGPSGLKGSEQKGKGARALTKWKRNGARAPILPQAFLKQTRRPQTRNWIGYRLPTKNPTGHRKAQCRVTQMHEPHRTPKHPNPKSPQGRISITIGKIAVESGVNKAQECHCGGTEVIGNSPPSKSPYFFSSVLRAA